MDLFFNALKGQVNSLNLIILLSVLAFLFYRTHRRRAGTVLTFFTVALFILFSTNYLPGYLIGRLESQHQTFVIGSVNAGDHIFIHVLGGGYNLDQKLPALGQLSLGSLGRLCEGIRIHKLLKKSTLVVSGNIASGDASMASVIRKAAISLGVDSLRIEMLEAPATTREEAQVFAERFGSRANVIVVTDAVHMPRAMKFFEEEGIRATAAPTNYLIKKDDNPFDLKWLPSVENFLLMDRVWREFFGSVKAILFGPLIQSFLVLPLQKSKISNRKS